MQLRKIDLSIILKLQTIFNNNYIPDKLQLKNQPALTKSKLTAKRKGITIYKLLLLSLSQPYFCCKSLKLYRFLVLNKEFYSRIS